MHSQTGIIACFVVALAGFPSAAEDLLPGQLPGVDGRVPMELPDLARASHRILVGVLAVAKPDASGVSCRGSLRATGSLKGSEKPTELHVGWRDKDWFTEDLPAALGKRAVLFLRYRSVVRDEMDLIGFEILPQDPMVMKARLEELQALIREETAAQVDLDQETLLRATPESIKAGQPVGPAIQRLACLSEEGSRTARVLLKATGTSAKGLGCLLAKELKDKSLVPDLLPLVDCNELHVTPVYSRPVSDEAAFALEAISGIKGLMQRGIGADLVVVGSLGSITTRSYTGVSCYDGKRHTTVTYQGKLRIIELLSGKGLEKKDVVTVGVGKEDLRNTGTRRVWYLKRHDDGWVVSDESAPPECKEFVAFFQRQRKTRR